MPTSHPLYPRVGIVYNPDKAQAKAEFIRLRRWLTQRGIASVVGTSVTPAMRPLGLVVALGGDGTVLGVARDIAAYSVPVLGVNMGRLGFLAATEVPALYKTLAKVLAGRGRIESRTMISVEGTAHGRPFGPSRALNDCVLRTGATGRLLHFEAIVRGRLLASYRADGLIVATPTGSTAYNLAASGPIVYPDLDALIVTPICPHTLAQRPLVLPTYEIILIEIGGPSPEALLTLDGVVWQRLRAGDRVEIRRAAEQVQLMMDPDSNYYEVLQNKLKWGRS